MKGLGVRVFSSEFLPDSRVRCRRTNIDLNQDIAISLSFSLFYAACCVEQAGYQVIRASLFVVFVQRFRIPPAYRVYVFDTPEKVPVVRLHEPVRLEVPRDLLEPRAIEH